MNVADLLKGLATLAGMGFIALIVFVVLQSSKGRQTRPLITLAVVVLVLAVVFGALGSGVVFIDPDEAGVVISAVSPKGYRDQPLGSGLHFIIPFVEYVKTYPISKQNYTMSISTNEGQVQGDDSITARTLDGQEIYIDSSVIFQIDPAKVVQVHIQWQDRYSDDLVRAQARGAIRDAVSQFRVEEVVSTKRFEMTQQVTDVLAKKLADNGLLLVDFVLRNITFSKEYAASVEQKQISEQQAQQAKFVVESKKQEAEQARQEAQGSADSVVIRAKGDADARVIQAQAEAQALQLIGDAINKNPGILTYNYIDKLSPNIQVMLVPNDNPYILPLPSTNLTPTTTSNPH